jgi:hypothetical protein
MFEYAKYAKNASTVNCRFAMSMMMCVNCGSSPGAIGG